MCTAITYKTKNSYFGRNLDWEHSFGEEITITPRNFPLTFKKLDTIKTHYAIIGMAITKSNYPLYFDAVNEMGLCAAGLIFPDNAFYNNVLENHDNIAPFELIPWILAKCSSVNDAKELLSNANIVNISFDENLKLSPLHWIISDKNCSITVEPLKSGLKIYENPIGVLTNNPTFDVQMLNLSNYMTLSNTDPENNFSNLELHPYCRGMGTINLPGGVASPQRFVRAAFLKSNSISGSSEEESVNQFFHILNGVSHQRGCLKVCEGKYEITIYSSCCNTDKCIYYYTTYENTHISGVDLYKENIDGKQIINYPLIRKPKFLIQN